MSKIEKITKQLQHEQADAAWITTPLNVFYFTGYRSEPHERLFALLITANGDQTLYCPKMEVEEVKNSPFEGKIIGYLDTENPFEIDPLSFNKLLIESEHLTVKRQRELTQNFGVQHYGDIDQTIKELRNIKNESEIENIREAAKLADKCIEIGTEFLKVGVTEREVVNHIENEIKKFGVSEMSFDTMVLFGDHAASPHGTPGERKLVKDEVSNVEQNDLLLDILTPKQSYADKDEFSDQMISSYEMEYLGFYVSNHPVEKQFNKKQYLGIYTLSNVVNHKPILVQVDQIKQIRTKNGQNMAFLVLNDGRHTMDAVLFPDKFKRYETQLNEREMYVVWGKFEKRKQQLQLILNQMDSVEHFEVTKINEASQIILRNIQNLDEIKQILNDHKNNHMIKVNIYNEQTGELDYLDSMDKTSNEIKNFVEAFDPKDIRIL